MTNAELVETAQKIINANLYLTIATVDEHGSPWASPVYFATEDGIDFYWISAPETRHSRALATHPEVSLMIFDSAATPGLGDALVMTAAATQIGDADEAAVARALSIYPGPAERGGRPFSAEQVSGGAQYRLYRARAHEWFVQCPWGQGACLAHGLRYDHRIAVDLSGGLA